MQARRLLNGLAFLVSCNSMLFDSAAADRVHKMSKLLGFPGWRDLEPLVIIDGGVRLNLEDLLRADGRNRVTVNNVDDKIRQAHHFLSCRYALVFLTYKEYVYSLGQQCNKMNSFSRQERECLKKFMRISDGEILVSRMQSALSWFESVFSQAPTTNDVFDILTRFGDAYRTTDYPKNGDDIFKHTAYDTIKTLNDLEKSAVEFFENHCGPVWHLKEQTVSSSTYSWVVEAIDVINCRQTDPVAAVNEIYTMVSNAINDFLVTDYARLGFAFSPESGTTVLNENPHSIRRIRHVDEILKHPGWSQYLGDTSIVVHNRQYGVGDLLAADLDEDCIDETIRRVYELMSCYYVELLKELLSHNKSVSRFFDSGSSAEKFVFVRSFVQTIKKSGPVIIRMKGSLLYFQRLSPHTGFDRYILQILDFYKNSIERMNFYDSDFFVQDSTTIVFLDDELLTQKDVFLSDLSEIESEVIKTYSQMSCMVPDKLTNNEVPEDSQTGVEKIINKTIDSFIYDVFPNLGFVYSPFSRQTVSLKSEHLN